MLASFGAGEIQLESLKLLPGTPLAEQAAEHGLFGAPDPPYEVLQSRECSSVEMDELRMYSMLIDRFYNHAMLQPVSRILNNERPSFFAELLHFIREQVGDFDAPMSLQRRAQLLFRYADEWSKDAADQLQYEWMSFGLSPGSCPGAKPVRWKQTIPDHSTICYDVSSLEIRDAQTWYLEGYRSKWWFVFQRSMDRQRPVKICQLARCGSEASP